MLETSHWSIKVFVGKWTINRWWWLVTKSFGGEKYFECESFIKGPYKLLELCRFNYGQYSYVFNLVYQSFTF